VRQLGSKFPFTIPVKIAFLVLATVLVTVLAFSIYIFIKVKQDDEKTYAQTVSSLGLVMGEQLWRFQEEIKKDMTSILALINPSAPNRNLESIRIILQKNPQLLYFELTKLSEKQKGHKELIGSFNENALIKKAVNRDEIRKQIERDIDEFSEGRGSEINYHFKCLPDEFPVYIFEVDIKERLYAAFVLTKDIYSQIYNPTSSVDIILTNSDNDVIYFSRPEENFPRLAFFNLIENRITNQGLIEKFKNNDTQFAVHFYRAADGITLMTYKNLATAGLDRFTFLRDVIFFFGSVSLIMLLISFIFSKTLSERIKKLMGITERIVAGKYDMNVDIGTRDEVGELAQRFRRLGETLGEKETRIEKVTEMANRDALTGLYNRRFFKEKLEEYFRESAQAKKPLNVMLMDIDHYKRFNDEFGHQQGDIVIQQLAHLLNTLTRKNDLAARFGGDEFVVILRNTEPSVAQQIAERIREAFEQKKISKLGGEGFLSATCSIGVACFDGTNMNDPDELIKTADDYLYEAKRRGRNQVYSG